MPGETCYLSVNANHPELGAFFTANFKGRRSSSALHSDTAGLSVLLRCVVLPTHSHQAILLRMWRLRNLLYGCVGSHACLATCGCYNQDCM